MPAVSPLGGPLPSKGTPAYDELPDWFKIEFDSWFPAPTGGYDPVNGPRSIGVPKVGTTIPTIPSGGQGNADGVDAGNSPYKFLGLSPTQLALLGLNTVAGAFPNTGNTNTSTTGSSTGESASAVSGSSSFQQFLDSLSKAHTEGTSASTSTSTPNISPQVQQLLDQLTSRYQTLQAPALTGYAASQTQGINRNADLQSQAVQNVMASRGLSTSPAAGTAQAGIEAGRFADINKMQAGLPILQNTMNLANMNAAGNFAATVPHGVTTNTQGTNISDTTTGTQQNSTGQNWNNLFSYGTNASNNQGTSVGNTSGGGGVGGGLSGLATMLAYIYAQGGKP